jgi:large subunit ribosomal protein L29
MTGKEVHAMTDLELEQAIENAHQEMFNLRFQRASGQLENTNRFMRVRRDVARFKTVLRERQIWTEFEAGKE